MWKILLLDEEGVLIVDVGVQMLTGTNKYRTLAQRAPYILHSKPVRISLLKCFCFIRDVMRWAEAYQSELPSQAFT